jgi:pilus assembly protein CpaF
MRNFGPLDEFLEDETVTEIMANGVSQIYVEKFGKLQLTQKQFVDEKEILAVIENILKPLGRRIDKDTPFVDARLPDGSRVNIIIPPLSLMGPMITVRKFPKKRLAGSDFLTFGSASVNMLRFVELCVLARKNIIISGGAGTGKTTLLNIASSFIPPAERIITIEDAAELRLNQEHVGRLESRPPEISGKGQVTIRQLVINALRMRPDRIIVGECRSGEALDMLQAMNTGHDGSLTTVHSNTPRACIKRLEVMVLMAGIELPVKAIREQISSAINLIIHMARFSDGTRKITDISEITGMEGEVVTLSPIFEFRQRGVDKITGKIIGDFKATETIPTFLEELKSKGININMKIFE